MAAENAQTPAITDQILEHSTAQHISKHGTFPRAPHRAEVAGTDTAQGGDLNDDSHLPMGKGTAADTLKPYPATPTLSRNTDRDLVKKERKEGSCGGFLPSHPFSSLTGISQSRRGKIGRQHTHTHTHESRLTTPPSGVFIQVMREVRPLLRCTCGSRTNPSYTLTRMVAFLSCTKPTDEWIERAVDFG